MFWYEADLKAVELRRKRQLDQLSGPGRPLVFYGSSSFTLWENLAADFAPRPVVNLAFGGSTLAACCWFFRRVVGPVKSSGLVLYAGDNDLGAGRHPEEILNQLRMLCYRWQKERRGQPLFFLSVKPSPARREHLSSLRFLNQQAALICGEFQNVHYIDIAAPMMSGPDSMRDELFAEDGLHLSPAGYTLWKSIIAARLDEVLGKPESQSSK